jgi:hypothetical protein
MLYIIESIANYVMFVSVAIESEANSGSVKHMNSQDIWWASRGDTMTFEKQLGGWIKNA